MNNLLSQPPMGDDPLAMLESALSNTLKPVMPNPEFVRKLGHRIINPPSITLERRTEMKVFLVFAFALFSGVLVIWLLIYLVRFLRGKSGSE
jgi:hypothetical protein